jgi:hypothetical protein
VPERHQFRRRVGDQASAVFGNNPAPELLGYTKPSGIIVDAAPTSAELNSGDREQNIATLHC